MGIELKTNFTGIALPIINQEQPGLLTIQSPLNFNSNFIHSYLMMDVGSGHMHSYWHPGFIVDVKAQLLTRLSLSSLTKFYFQLFIASSNRLTFISIDKLIKKQYFFYCCLFFLLLSSFLFALAKYQDLAFFAHIFPNF